ncbi:RsmB/NOP family class I SAM-dependent RNA methyltransferase [Parasphingopyxis marina]|uniref:RsmB/NOP family class I SAM-dependent RNA methyltransferase n=1 Tax=Parasphingopyxis marina TaxID=2761622 RepID=A0A842HZE2_9SPHN|nr:RsmB/NOP family class I SAM-dependent RNA methyltransferase [Parasphingopyxis marina]MBC2777897.1 RsmB/NOP family class I SAM-dependent RNA methyltransferase [Parasphingopyxis marina]
MLPAARLQAAIELLDEIIAAARDGGAAADTLIQRYFRTRRYAGSKDRRAVRDLVYRAIRGFGEAPASGRAAMIGLTAEDPELLPLFDGSPHGPEPIGEGEAGASATPLPAWLRTRFASTVDDTDIASLSGRAPLDIRVNLSRTTREEVLAAIPDAEPGRLSASSVRLPDGFRIEDHALWHEGHVDIQDEGSQLLVDAADPRAGTTIVDLCAGAGGKTLALWDRTGGKARIVACDTDRARLSRLAPRAARSGFTDIETRLLDPGKEAAALGDLDRGADLLFVDAPCSGTGTWRRNPEARWRLTDKRIAGFVAAQHHILEFAAPLVAPGGILLYAVCSLLAAEGEDQIANFLTSRSDFRKVDCDTIGGVASGQGYLLTPARHGTDGFFFARLERSC